MLFAGLPDQGWNDFFYASVEEISDQDKALSRWAQTTSIQAESFR